MERLRPWTVITKAFTFSAAIILGLCGLVKLWNLSGSVGIRVALDPVLLMEQRTFSAVLGFFELTVAAYLLCARNQASKLFLIFWLSANFALYRLVLWWSGSAQPCSCLGVTADVWWQEWGKVVERLLPWLVAYLLFGSLTLLLERFVVIVKRWLGPRGRQRLKWSTGCLVVVLLFPGIQVGCAAKFNPPTTVPMLLRHLKGDSVPLGIPENRFVWCGLPAVSSDLVKAVVAAEDVEFFRHRGFSWEQVRYSINTSIRQNRPVRAVSTISQQCARSLFLWQGRSWIRKALEAYYTVWMELLLGKRRIMELYLNVIELGDGIYGIEAAAQHYYGKSARDLTREEAAMLAAILPAPKRWNPLQPNERVQRRQQNILRRMEHVHLPWEPPEETARSRAPSDASVPVQPKPEPPHESVLATNSPSPASP